MVEKLNKQKVAHDTKQCTEKWKRENNFKNFEDDKSLSKKTSRLCSQCIAKNCKRCCAWQSMAIKSKINNMFNYLIFNNMNEREKNESMETITNAFFASLPVWNITELNGYEPQTTFSCSKIFLLWSSWICSLVFIFLYTVLCRAQLFVLFNFSTIPFFF